MGSRRSAIRRTTAAGALAALAALAVAEEAFHDGGAAGCRCHRLLRTEGMAFTEQRFDAATGQDLRNYPPDRLVDYLHMNLDIDIEDMNEPTLSGTQVLVFRAIADEIETLTLDARQLQIEGAWSRGEPNDLVELGTDSFLTRFASASRERATPFHHDGDRLTLTFDPPLERGETYSVMVQYSATDPPDGLFWTPESDEWPGRPAQIHTQGQPETNSYWFPCHDFPNDRVTARVRVTIPDEYTASANGVLEDRTARDGRVAYTWLLDQDHPVYLATLVVGEFDVVDVAPEGHRVPMPVYVPEGWADRVERTYGNTAEMLRVFEERFDEPYPWKRYAQLVVWNFGAGGMENTTATTMYDTAAFDEKAMLDNDLDGLISHELAHQWFGDLLTCNSWDHIWLNEGWATYSTALWYEARDGYEPGYQRRMRATMRRIAQRDHLADGSDETRPAMVSRVYSYPWETFRRVSNPYGKGASVLHMLRHTLGEETFFRGVARYIDDHKFSTVETDEFRRALEDASGRSLERFFEQWVHRPGTPDVTVSADWDAARSELKLVVEQTQRIDADHPAFVFDLPIEVSTAPGAEPVRVVVGVDSRRHERAVPLETAPTMVEVDPDLTVLMRVTPDMSADWLRTQAFEGRTLASRIDATDALSAHAGARTVETLVRRTGSGNWALRQEAFRSLGVLGAGDEIETLLDDGVDDARVRLEAIRALGTMTERRWADTLARHADDEGESYACRAAALEALGTVGSAEDLEIYARALASESQHDQVRAGALRGLKALDEAPGLAMAIPFTRPGNLNRLRPVAIDAVAALSRHDADAAFRAVAPLLADREARTVNAAGEALVLMEDDRGLAPLERVARSARDPQRRARAEGWSARLGAALGAEASDDATRRELERVRRELEALRRDFEKR